MRTSNRFTWGKDKSGVWHVMPTMYIGGLGLVDHQCTTFDSYVKVNGDAPPNGATVCPYCRGFLARTVVEDV